MLLLEHGQVLDRGPRADVLDGAAARRLFGTGASCAPVPLPAAPDAASPQPGDGPLIELENVHAHYGEHAVLDGVSLRLDPGEHLCIAGPNGCGKSTLLALICGDNPRAYGQQVKLFGRVRGSGESVWEIKRRFGIVSNQLHLSYPTRTRAFDVVASGFFDTLGLYDTCGPWQAQLVREWLAVLGLSARAGERFDALSFGEQRMMLVARAMVKNPPILILDEPCSGLDEANRRRVLELIERIGHESRTQMLYVSHEAEEMPGLHHAPAGVPPGSGWTLPARDVDRSCVVRRSRSRSVCAAIGSGFIRIIVRLPVGRPGEKLRRMRSAAARLTACRTEHIRECAPLLVGFHHGERLEHRCGALRAEWLAIRGLAGPLSRGLMVVRHPLQRDMRCRPGTQSGRIRTHSGSVVSPSCRAARVR